MCPERDLADDRVSRETSVQRKAVVEETGSGAAVLRTESIHEHFEDKPPRRRLPGLPGQHRHRCEVAPRAATNAVTFAVNAGSTVSRHALARHSTREL
eukprot:COSAG06_NODE_4800_length_3944_cov_2.745124_3_plen_98_part_00